MESFVFVGCGTDDIKAMYDDFKYHNNTDLIFLDRKICRRKLITRILYSHKNPFSPLIKKIFNYQKYVSYSYKDFDKQVSIKNNLIDSDIVFIIYGRVFEEYGMSLINYLKRKYKKIKFVIYFGDLLSSHKIDLNLINSVFLRKFSFDSVDAKMNNMFFLQEPFSYDSKYENGFIDFDISFIGAEKGRLFEILKVFELAKNKGLKTDFHIINVPENKQQYTDNIKYNERLPFSEVLKNVNKSKAILEVMQEGAFSPTTRYAEALLYKKYLITNCAFFNPKIRTNPPNIIYYENINEIDFNKISIPLQYDNTDYIKSFSIERFVQTIKNVLDD